MLSLCGPTQAQQAREINFGILSTESSQNLKQDWAPIIEDMTRHLGVKVNAFFAPDYAGIIEAMRFGKVHAGWLGNKPGIEAVDRANGEVFMQVVTHGGVAGYWSLLIVHRDSPIQSVADLIRDGRNLNFGLGDPNSTSGFLVPSYYLLAQNRIDPKTQFKAVRNANHEANFMAVANKQLDAAVVSSEILDRYKEKNPARVQDVRVVWRSPLIAADPMVWRKDLPDDIKSGLRSFFLAYGSQPRERQLLSKLLADGFRESSNAQLIPFRQLELFKDRSKLENDTNMSATERQTRIEAINKKLAELSQQTAALK
jgi:phosphonate transport system substrate-binding protein